MTLQASGENGVHIWQASGPYDPAAPTTNPTGAQWVKGINDVGTSAEDSTSNLLNDITITEIAGEGSFYYTYTTSYISRFNLNKYATSGGSTPDQLTYSVAFPFDVEFYDEYEARVAAKGAVIFTKTDLDTGEALGGAQYSLYRVVDGDDELIGTYTTGTTEDTLGQIVVTGLEAGNYYFTEIAPPTNAHKINPDPVNFIIADAEMTTGSATFAAVSGEAPLTSLAVTTEAADGNAVVYERDTTVTSLGRKSVVQATTKTGQFLPSDTPTVLRVDSSLTDDEIENIVLTRGEVSRTYETLAAANAAVALVDQDDEANPFPTSGKLTAVVNYITEGTANAVVVGQADDTYDVVNVITAASKTLDGGDITEGQFTFEINGISANTEDYHQQAVCNALGEITFPELGITGPGIYTYSIKETAGNNDLILYDDTEYIMVVTSVDFEGELNVDSFYLTKEVYDAFMTANEDGITAENVGMLADSQIEGELVFANTLMQQLDIIARKTLTGGQLRAGAFSFTLTAVTTDGDRLLETVTNNAEGVVAFSEINIGESGIYTYKIKEVDGGNPDILYDPTEYYFIADVNIAPGEGSARTLYVTKEVYDAFTTDGAEVTSENFEALETLGVEIAGFENTALAPQTGENDDLLLNLSVLVSAALIMANALKRKKLYMSYNK